MNSPYDGPDTDVDVNIEINGVTHSASVHVFADTYFYSIYPEYYDKSILLGQRFMNTVFSSPKLNEICTKHELSSLVKYNVEIVNGQQFGHLIDPTTKNRVSSLSNLNHDNGKLDFEFSADSFDVNSNNTVVIKISTNKTTIEPINVTYHVARAKIQVTFSPPTLVAGDTANVILKKINDDGTLSDFPADKYFDAQITDGKDYGTFISPESSDTLDQLSCVYQGFKFIANKKIPASQVQSTIIVNTTLFTASKIIPGKDGLNKNVSTDNKSISKLKKTTSTKDDEQLWGMGTVTITKEGIKVYFDKANISTGDTATLIIKWIDLNGGEFTYPAETKFEVGVEAGCGYGKILTSDGTKGEFFGGIPEPIRFVADTGIVNAVNSVIKVGAPNLTINAKVISKGNKSVTESSGKKTVKQLTNSENIKIIAKAKEDNICNINNYTLPKIAEAPITIEDKCNFGDCGNFLFTYKLIEHTNPFTQMNGSILDVCSGLDPRQVSGIEYVPYSLYNFNVLDNKWEKSFRTKACKKNGKIKLRILEPRTDQDIPATINLDYVIGICEQKLSALNKICIKNIDDLNIYNNDVHNLMQDICGHSCSPVISNKYYINEINYAHENEHKNQYLQSLNNNISILNQLNNLEYDCESYNLDHQDDSDENVVLARVTQFFNTAKNYLMELSGQASDSKPKNDTKYNENEQFLENQESVKLKIVEYSEQVKKNTNQMIPSDCYKCKN